MALSLKRINDAYQLRLSHENDESNIKTMLSNLRFSDRQKLMTQHDVIAFEYRVLSAKLIKNFHDNEIDDAVIQTQIHNLQAISSLLKIIYKDYLNVPREVSRFDRDNTILKRLLQGNYQQLPQDTTFYLSQCITGKTGETNVIRLLLARLRRMFVGLSLFTSANSSYAAVFNVLHPIIMQSLLYFSWIFFIPRLSSQVFFTLKHLFPYHGMSQEEKDLGWKTRLSIQWAQRWPDIGNDITWFAVGVLNCFVLLGALAPLTVFVAFGLQVCDVVLAALRLYLDISKYKALKKDYQNQLVTDDSLTEEEKNHLKQLVTHFDTLIADETKRLSVVLFSASMILVSLIFTFSVLAINPVFVLCGGILAVSTSLIAIAAQKHLRKTKTTTELDALLKAPSSTEANPRFFQTTDKSNKAKDDNTEANTFEDDVLAATT